MSKSGGGVKNLICHNYDSFFYFDGLSHHQNDMKTIYRNVGFPLLLVSPSYAAGLTPGFNPNVPVLC